MSWLITPQQRIPTVIGEPFGGGYFAGYISTYSRRQPHSCADRGTQVRLVRLGLSYTLTTMLAVEDCQHHYCRHGQFL
jgi:hypothetical protein